MADQSVTNNRGVAQAWHPAPRPTHPNWRDLTGKVFFRLTVREYVGRGNKGAQSYWLCDCVCGAQTVASGGNLVHQNVRSCGCWRDEEHVRRATTHGHKRHGRRTPEYGSWSGMRDRCLNPSDAAFHKYGGRGITIDPRWESFENFLADMGPKPGRGFSIERCDNDGPYSPDNCKWGTYTEQSRNKRNTAFVEFRGQRMKVVEVAEMMGVRYGPLIKRLYRGWTIERAVAAPLGVRR